jgi:parvulin-like peptidyl-prolyl isomerase
VFLVSGGGKGASSSSGGSSSSLFGKVNSFFGGSDSPVIAKVNGEKITQEELDSLYKRLPEQYKSLVSKQVLLEQLIDERLLYEEALKQGYGSTDEEVRTIITQSILLSGLTEEQFYARLAQENVTKEYLVNFYKKQVSINKMLNETVISKVAVSDEEIAQVYQAQKSALTQPEQRQASHILFLITEEQDDEQALEKAKDLRARLTKENFADLAKENSQDPGSAPSGGDLGLFRKGMMVQEFEQAVFSMKVGSISGPVRTAFGYHLIYLTNVLVSRQLELEEVREDLKSQLQMEKQRKMYEQYITSLRSDATIERTLSTDSSTGFATFKETGEPLCTEEGKPVVRMYSLSTCSHCQWIDDTFNGLASVYANKIAVEHWQLDTGDNTLTVEKEAQVPADEKALFEKYSPSKHVPLFVFGCSHVRIGNGYEQSDDLAKEEAEMRQVLDKLLG